VKKTLVALLCAALPLLVACSGGGLGSPDEPVKYNGYEFATFSTPGDVRAVAGREAQIFAGTGSGLYLGDPISSNPGFTKVTAAGFPTDALTQTVNALLFEASGSLLIGTDNGLYRRNPDGIITAVADFAGLKVTALTEKKTTTEKQLWVGLFDLTAAKTIARQKDAGAFTFYGKANGMTASRTTMIFCDPDSTLTMACGVGSTTESGLFQFAESTGFTKLSTQLSAGATFFQKKGDVWYTGGADSGIQYKSGNADWTVLTAGFTPYGMADHAASLYTETWVPTNAGLRLYLDMNDVTLFKKGNRLTIDTCGDVDVSDAGIWIAHPASGTVTGGISHAIYTGE